MASFLNPTAVTAHSAVTDLTVFPPLSAAYVGPETDNENSKSWEQITAFDVEVDVPAGETFAGLKLLGIEREAGAIADDTFTAAATDICTATAHGLNTGDGPVQVTTTDTLPAGLSALTDYWIIKIDANTFYFAASLEDAFAGNAVDISDAGTGTHTLSDDVTNETTKRSKHVRVAFLGSSTGALVLAANERYVQRINQHSARFIAYAVTCGTHTAGAATTVKLYARRRGG